jgi:mono/diheme cytochrome c family protein
MTRARLALPTFALLTVVLAACNQPAPPASGDTAKAEPAAKAEAHAKPEQAAEDPKGTDAPAPTDGSNAAALAKPADAGGDVATGEPAANDTPPAEPAEPTAPDAAPADAKKPADSSTSTKKPTTTDDGGGAAPGVDGKELYLGKCKSCHGPDGKGDTSMGKKVREAGGEFPSLAGTKLAKAKIVEIVENGVPDTKMKGYKDKLSKDEIDAIAGYVKKL